MLKHITSNIYLCVSNNDDSVYELFLKALKEMTNNVAIKAGKTGERRTVKVTKISQSLSPLSWIEGQRGY